MSKDSAPSGNRLKFLGIASIILGVIALAAPAVAAGAVVIVVGATLLLAGVSQVFQGLKGEGWRDKIMPVVLGIITGIAGLGVLAHPILGLGVLSLMLAIYFFIEGIWKIIAAFRFKPNPAWVWMLLGGILSLVLGYLIWNQWPLSGIVAVGVLVGVDLI
ncbi:MAG: DUF308 domain-containing protein, partial [Gammaproteobacteria bacterium]